MLKGVPRVGYFGVDIVLLHGCAKIVFQHSVNILLHYITRKTTSDFHQEDYEKQHSILDKS